MVDSDCVKLVEVGLFPARSGLPAAVAETLRCQRGGQFEQVVVGEREIGVVRTPTSTQDALDPAKALVGSDGLGGWTTYEVRAGTQRGRLTDMRALVLSEEDAFQVGVDVAEYERWVDREWGPGVTDLPGYRAAFLMRGVAGSRRGGYASIGWFTDAAAREKLLVALTDEVPEGLRGYRRLIDVAFGRYLNRGHRRFYRLNVEG